MDEADLPTMLADAVGGPGWKFQVMSPLLLRPHQYVNHNRAMGMPVEVALKPIIISLDGGVVDGNHRLYRYKNDLILAKIPMNVLKLNLGFEEALDWLDEQVYTYHINPRTHERN